MDDTLQRFVDATLRSFDIVKKELQNGKKITHWMWYIFPQIKGLGTSNISLYYAIKNKDEAIEYLNNDYLYDSISKLCNILLNYNGVSIQDIFGKIDTQKLLSSMTLFNYILTNFREKIKNTSENIFNKIIIKYFNGIEDFKTIELLS